MHNLCKRSLPRSIKSEENIICTELILAQKWPNIHTHLHLHHTHSNERQSHKTDPPTSSLLDLRIPNSFLWVNNPNHNIFKLVRTFKVLQFCSPFQFGISIPPEQMGTSCPFCLVLVTRSSELFEVRREVTALYPQPCLICVL